MSAKKTKASLFGSAYLIRKKAAVPTRPKSVAWGGKPVPADQDPAVLFEITRCGTSAFRVSYTQRDKPTNVGAIHTSRDIAVEVVLREMAKLLEIGVDAGVVIYPDHHIFSGRASDG